MGLGELSDYELKLLAGWEDVHKKGQLTLWIFLALKESPKHMSDIKSFVQTKTHGAMTADDQSMYRALRRYHDSELVEFKNEPGNAGPERKVYELTNSGAKILETFLERNIINTILNPDILDLLKKK